jgi:hypothetical protein
VTSVRLRNARLGSQRGQTMAEYSVVLGVMVLACIAAFTAFDGSVLTAILAHVTTILTAF